LLLFIINAFNDGLTKKYPIEVKLNSYSSY